MRHRHRGPLRVDADAAGEGAGVGDEHVGRAMDAAIEVDDAVPRILVDRIAAVRVAARQGDIILFADRIPEKGVDIHVGRDLLPLRERGIAFKRAGGEMQDRKRVVEGKGWSISYELGGRRNLKKKK